MDAVADQNLELCFVDPLPNEYVCPVCGQVLRYPVQLEQCGHHVCSGCLPEVIRQSSRCPIDGVVVDREKVSVDKPVQRAIQCLLVVCPFHEGGCEWRARVVDMPGHIEECEHALVQCPRGCGTLVERRSLDDHRRSDCRKEMVQCEHCREDVLRDGLVGHWDQQCLCFPSHCPNGCGAQNIERGKLHSHTTSECPKASSACPFAEFGCEYEGDWGAVQRHAKEEPARHLSLLCDGLAEVKRTVHEAACRADKNGGAVDQLNRKLDRVEKLYGPQMLWKVDNFSLHFEEAKSGQRPVLFSPPFYTGKHGYKMALSACLYGDGRVRGQFVSLYVCICKGDYDALLPWPFGHRIVFTLLDQCQDPAGRRDITYALKPNTCKENRPFLSRPTGQRNASFGAQRFCELEALEKLDYVRDNTVFIKVRVSTEDITPL